MARIAALALALLGLWPLSAVAQPPTVKVRLSFSVKEFDPAKPGKAVVRCVVRNDTLQQFEVPSVYDGKAVVLRAGGLALERTGQPVGGKPPADGARRVRLDPKEERVVFELPLAAVLVEAGRKDGGWRWVWRGKGERPARLPRTPLYDGRGEVRPAAEFECDVYFTAPRPVTGKAVLTVKRPPR
jgi:hypothetical protein